jgi:hypothetical protein
MDTDYRDKVVVAVWKAIVEASMNEVAGNRIAMVQSAESVSALIRVMGMLMATSEATSTPAKLRATCDEVAKRLRSWTANVREDGSIREMFDRVVEGTTQ